MDLAVRTGRQQRQTGADLIYLQRENLAISRNLQKVASRSWKDVHYICAIKTGN
jgi:hypothetical protein